MSAGDNKALVLLSGGQDSTTCLYWAIDRWGRENLLALSFDYGQRHRIELDCAEAIAKHAGVAHRHPRDRLRRTVRARRLRERGSDRPAVCGFGRPRDLRFEPRRGRRGLRW